MLLVAVEAAHLRVAEPQALAGACDGDVGKPALLLELGLVGAEVVHMGEDALLHAGDEHVVELQALGGVDGHERDAGLALAHRVEIGAQGKPFHEARQAQLAGDRTLLLGDLPQRIGRLGGRSGVTRSLG